MILYVVKLNLKKVAFQDSFLRICLEQFFGYYSHLPFDYKFLSKDEEDMVISYCNNRADIPIATTLTRI